MVGIAESNPLGLTIAGVAVGFIMGIFTPSTKTENEKLGPMADQVKQGAVEVGQEALEHGKQVAKAAGESAADTAREQGQEHGEELQSSLQQKAPPGFSGASLDRRREGTRVSLFPSRPPDSRAGVDGAVCAELGARADLELSVDAGEARLDGLGADEEGGGDLTVRQPAACQVGDALLRRGQRHAACRAAAERPQLASCASRPERRA